MSKADEVRRYADEAMRWAETSTTAKEHLALLKLARQYEKEAARLEQQVNERSPTSGRSS